MRCSSAGVMSCLLLAAGLAGQETKHNREFWRAIAEHHYEVPSGGSASVLAHELSGLLASPEPELRDDLAYSILTRWISRMNVLQPDDLRALADEWTSNLKEGIGESGTNSVLKRSFSALCLASIAEREAKAPFLGASRYRQLLAAAAAYLQAERDLRGYDAQLGWIHATAHTADLLQALAAAPMLTAEEENRVLSAIAARLSSAPQVYSQGEQDRLAQAVVAVVRRADFKVKVFEIWLSHLQEEDKRVWLRPLTVASLAVYQNHTYLLQALVVHLELEPESEKITIARREVLDVLRTR